MATAGDSLQLWRRIWILEWPHPSAVARLRFMKMGGLTIIVVLSLTGCASPSTTGAKASASPTSTPSVSTSVVASAGDSAACKAYLRVEPMANQSLKEGFGGLPTSIIASFFTRWADNLESGTVTATDPALIGSIKGTVGGLRSGAATANAWTSGDLDLLPDLTVVYEESTKVATACSPVDPTGTYVAIVNAG